jgi:hypothetical protein
MLYGIRIWAVSVVLADACRGAMFVEGRPVGAVGVDQSIHNTKVNSDANTGNGRGNGALHRYRPACSEVERTRLHRT